MQQYPVLYISLSYDILSGLSTPLRSKGAVFKCGKMFPIVPSSLFAYFSFAIRKYKIFGYFALIISQICVRKCVILRMPINNADFPIADNNPAIKIDNPVERVYLYRVTSTSNAAVIRSGLRFYKYKQKFNGLDTFISEDGAYYISAFRISGPVGNWIIAPTIGQGGSSGTRLGGNVVGSFFPRGIPVEGSYSSIAVTISLAKITSDTR